MCINLHDAVEFAAPEIVVAKKIDNGEVQLVKKGEVGGEILVVGLTIVDVTNQVAELEKKFDGLADLLIDKSLEGGSH